MKLQTEAELIQGAVEGNEKATTELYNRLRPSIYRIVLKYARDIHLAEDATQYALSKAIMNISDYNGTAAFKTWIVTIARRYLIDQYRKFKVIRKHTTPALAKFQIDRYEEIDAKERIDAAMKHLPKPHAELINMVCLHNYSYEEASKAFGVPIGTIKSRLCSHKKKLSEHLSL